MNERQVFRGAHHQKDQERLMDYDPYRDDPEMRYRLEGDFKMPFLHDVAPFNELVRTKREKGLKMIVVVPTKNEGEITPQKPEGNIGETLTNLMPLIEKGLADEVLVIDSESTDDTRAIARSKGSTVLLASEYYNELGFTESEYRQGKGTNLWLATARYRGKPNHVLGFFDADFGINAAQAQAIFSPIIMNDEVQMSLAWMIRETQQGDPSAPVRPGGRATEAGFKPMMRLFLPKLDGIQQPIAGGYAVREDALENFEFAAGYGIETELFTQTDYMFGPEAFAQTFCGTKRQTGQSTDKIYTMTQYILHHWIDHAYDKDRPLHEPTNIIRYPTYKNPDGTTVVQRVEEPYQFFKYPPAKDIFPRSQ